MSFRTNDGGKNLYLEADGITFAEPNEDQRSDERLDRVGALIWCLSQGGMMNLRHAVVCAVWLWILQVAGTAAAATPVASYFFNHTLAAAEPGTPALTAVDPLGTSGFTSDTIFGQTRPVYLFTGHTTPGEQGGLALDTTGLLSSPSMYTIELGFELLDRDGAARRILDVANRQSDDGLYVDAGNHLAVFPAAAGTTDFTNNEYHHVVVTNDGGTVAGYLDGSLEFTTSTSAMDINNPANLMNFFLDNVTGAGQGDYSSGKIGLLRLYDVALAGDQIGRLNTDAPPPATVPEPGTATLLGLGVGTLALAARRKANR